MRKLSIFFIKFSLSFARRNYDQKQISKEEWVSVKWYLLRKLVKLIK